MRTLGPDTAPDSCPDACPDSRPEPVPGARRLARALRSARRRARGFGRARSGQVALLFGAMSIPILFGAGAAIDYGRRNAAKAQLDAAIDGAVLALISQKTNTLTADNLRNAETQFRTEAAKFPGVTVNSFAINPVSTASTLSLTATYNASVKTTLGSMMNVPALNIAGASGSTRNVFQYIDFYLLLDNSPSMGLAATDTDVSNMQRATGGCAFGCHLLNSNGTENTNDNYNIAKRNNIKLRIQVVRDAVASLVDKAKSSMTLSQQFRMEMWTFSDIQTKLTSLTTSLDQVKSDSTKIDLAYSYQNQSDNQTAYQRAFKQMNTTIPASGTGVIPTSPIRFLFFVTDGVQDTPIDKDGITNASEGYKITGNRFISPIDPATCQALKSNGVRIAVLYTTYLPIPSDGFYMNNIAPFSPKIPTTLQACASDGLFFQVSSGGDITAAMLKMFDASLASVRITN